MNRRVIGQWPVEQTVDDLIEVLQTAKTDGVNYVYFQGCEVSDIRVNLIAEELSDGSFAYDLDIQFTPE
jgi:hypothetical protein